MRKISLVALLIFISIYSLSSQQDNLSARNSMTVVFYSVENLFDTINNPAANDEEFLPGSTKHWNGNKYLKKINDLGSAIASINEKELPSIIGLAEVENLKVVQDLALSPKLKKSKYGIVHFDSKDESGTDVALLYNTEEIDMLDSKAIPVSSGTEIKDVTRDILYAKCRIKGDKTIHFFINHWPSRTPTAEESEVKRIMTAVTLRKEVDNILNVDNNANIIIMGDFNDEPTNRSILQMLNATNKLKNLNYRDLYNLMYDAHNIKGEGTVINNDGWQMFDQIIVSQTMLKKGNGYFLLQSDGKVSRNDMVMTKDPSTGGSIINRTYNGDKYTGGVSDHLPVYAILRKEGR